MWAEYPGEGGATWATRPDLAPAEQERLAEIRGRDRRQYVEWLRQSGESE